MSLMQDDFPLNLHHIRRRMRSCHPSAEVVTLTEQGTVRASYGEISERVDRLARALGRLGIEPGDRVGTFAWNNQRHFELYMAVPCVGAVLHTLNVRLFAEQIVYIVNHAEDRVIFVDDSLVPILEKLALADAERRALHVDGGRGSRSAPNRGSNPDHPPQRAALRGAARGRDGDGVGVEEAFDYPELDERQAASLCYTSGTTGNPKGVLYSHRSICLHATASLFADNLGALAPRPRAGDRADVPRQRLGDSLRRRARRRGSADARPLPAGGAAGTRDRVRAPHGRGLRADDLRRPAALCRHPRRRPLLADPCRLRRLGRAAAADEGLPGASRRAHLPGLGDDRDESRRHVL